MSSIKIVIEDVKYTLDLDKIPKNSYFEHMIQDCPSEEKYVINNISQVEFEVVYNYLQKGIIPLSNFESFDYFGIDMTHSYELSLAMEEDMRKNMYSKEFTDKYHGLVKVNLGIWKDLILGFKEDPNLLFNTCSLEKNNWDNITERLSTLKRYTDIPGVFIAGGAIFSILFNKPIKDIDIFLYGISQEEAKETIKKISNVIISGYLFPLLDSVAERINLPNEIQIIRDYLENHIGTDCRVAYRAWGVLNRGVPVGNELSNLLAELGALILGWPYQPSCVRTQNAVTFLNSKYNLEVQVILRLYQSPSEIIHGFDVDSCCLGFDGDSVWMTHRAHYALLKGYNTVNFNRLSPSYEMRLVKYGTRGMPIKIPDFKRSKVDNNNLEEYFEEHKPRSGWQISNNYNHIKELRGIDLLIYFEYHCNHIKYRGIIDKLNKEFNDYDSVPLVHYSEGNGNRIINILGYLKYTEKEYLMFSKNYMPYIKLMENSYGIYIDSYENEHENGNEMDLVIKDKIERSLELRTNNIPSASKIALLKGRINDIDIILELPECIYNCLGFVKPWLMPREVTFKVTNPGEQMTNTFHQIVLDNNNTWYLGHFYSI